MKMKMGKRILGRSKRRMRKCMRPIMKKKKKEKSLLMMNVLPTSSSSSLSLSIFPSCTE